MCIDQRMTWFEDPATRLLFRQNCCSFFGDLHGPQLLGEGQDGLAYYMHTPSPQDQPLASQIAIKIWKPDFCARAEEVHLQSLLSIQDFQHFRVPKVYFSSMVLGAFAMKRVMGATIAQILAETQCLFTMALYEKIRSAFKELNLFGVVHGDNHLNNIMLTNCVEQRHDGALLLLDAKIWIIDFGRSFHGNGKESDLNRLDSFLYPYTY